MDTIKDKKIVAEFMNFPTEALKGRITDELAKKQYNDWNSLMPVIQKIIKTIGVKTIDECTDVEWNVSINVVRMYIGVDISQAFHYVVEYIKWYNCNKSN